MELILSNTPPVRLSSKTTSSCFEDLIHQADSLKIACGYVSAGALADLKEIFQRNHKSYLQLIIGMHHFEGITHPQYDEAKYLDDYLRGSNMGGVTVSTTFKYHGKVYSFIKGGAPFASMVGSSNLNSAFGFSNSYEVDLLVNEPQNIVELDHFIDVLAQRACTPFNVWKPNTYLEQTNVFLEDHEGVEKVPDDVKSAVFLRETGVKFTIPIKSDDAPQSNLNAYFGKGREDQRGYVKPRSWYEVELIVPSTINQLYGYPQPDNVFKVITDDGWMFGCKVSGDNSKNFRSADDLKILGRWMKGRLENKGALKVGQPVTSEVLRKYGRNTLELIGTPDPNVWLLNFGT